jgi:hypothetical protein
LAEAAPGNTRSELRIKSGAKSWCMERPTLAHKKLKGPFGRGAAREPGVQDVIGVRDVIVRPIQA